MKKTSDTRSLAAVSATEASRTFSALLDRVERGSQFVVSRRGRAICLMAPPQVLPRRISECLALVAGRASVPLDGRFGEDLRAIIAGEPAETRPWDS